jgi:hypothetical protein
MSSPEPETRHRACWYGRRTTTIPDYLGVQTIEDGQLLYCAHPLWFPIVGYRFDVPIVLPAKLRPSGRCPWLL